MGNIKLLFNLSLKKIYSILQEFSVKNQTFVLCFLNMVLVISAISRTNQLTNFILSIFQNVFCRKKSRENAPLCCDGVESLICSPMLSNVTPETPCDKIDEPASSIVIEDDLRIGLQGWPVLSLGFSSGDITSANSSAVSSVKMLVSIFGF